MTSKIVLSFVANCVCFDKKMRKWKNIAVANMALDGLSCIVHVYIDLSRFITFHLCEYKP